MNIIVNTSIMLMSTLMGGLTELMVNVTGAVASEMVEAINGEAAGEGVKKEIKQKLPEADEKMKIMISDVRKDLYVQLEQKRKDIAPFLSDATFDIGLKIIDKYEFKLPKLTEELDDDTLAQYAQLMASEDSIFNEMFQELTSWMNTLPKLPERSQL
ncbi:MAG: hypothetical protein NWE94_06645 [Candidatus Bathyarchaeota archaeon]|nr:hypothetical protein [Candidatus Bathyarchaeota archaeon]